MTAYEQRSYPGAAADTVLTADITAVATAFSVTAGTGTGYPDGSGGPFTIIIDYDNSKAEKIRCSGRVNDTFTVAGTGGGRGYDSTPAVVHTAPAKVRAVWPATDAQEANRAAANTIGRITSKGDLTPGSGANTTVRFAVGADGTLLVADSTQPGGLRWTSTGIVLDATSTLGGVSGTTLAAATAAWTAVNFTVDNTTAGYTATARMTVNGKTAHIQGRLSLTGVSSATILAYAFTGVTIRTPAADAVCGICQFSGASGAGIVWVDSATGKLKFQVGAFGTYVGTGVATANGNLLAFDITVELA